MQPSDFKMVKIPINKLRFPGVRISLEFGST